MFHVQGIIGDTMNAAVPHAEGHFVGDSADRTVIADEKGFYQTDLPVGIYTMTVAVPSSALFTKYIRFFRVPLTRTITLNGSLFIIAMECGEGRTWKNCMRILVEAKNP